MTAYEVISFLVALDKPNQLVFIQNPKSSVRDFISMTSKELMEGLLELPLDCELMEFGLIKYDA